MSVSQDRRRVIYPKPSVNELLDTCAKKTGVSVSSYVNIALKEKIERDFSAQERERLRKSK